MSPLLLKRTATPSSDWAAGIDVFRSAARTVAQVAVPFAQALSIAAATTCTAAYVGAPKYSPSPPCFFLKAAMIFDFGFSGKLVVYVFFPTPEKSLS